MALPNLLPEQSIVVTICHNLDPAQGLPPGSSNWSEDLSFIHFKPDVCVVRSVAFITTLNPDPSIYLISSDLLNNRDSILAAIPAIPQSNVSSPGTIFYGPRISAACQFSVWRNQPGFRVSESVAQPTIAGGYLSLTLEFTKYQNQ